MADPRKKNETDSENGQEARVGITIESKEYESAEELRRHLEFMREVGEPVSEATFDRGSTTTTAPDYAKSGGAVFLSVRFLLTRVC